MSAPNFLTALRLEGEFRLKSLWRLYRRSLDADDDVSFIWIGDDYRAVCIDLDSARVHASLWDDGYGKFYPTVYVSLFAACRSLLREPVVSIRLCSPLRCALDLLRFKCSSMSEAKEALEQLLLDLKVI